MNLKPVTYKIIYNQKDITRDISDHLLSLSYTDKVEGEADELNIDLDDKDGYWQNDWYPQKGDTIEAEINDNGSILPCGKFTIDEVKLNGSKSGGDTISISAVSASVKKALRSKKNTAHEFKTLREIANSVAKNHSLKIQGTIPDIRFDRVTQYRETDLAFLSRIAGTYGVTFSIKGDILVFTKRSELEKANAVNVIDKTDVTDFSFTDKTETTFKSVTVNYHNPVSAETITKTITPGVDPDVEVPEDIKLPEDTETLNTKVENEQQAEEVAKTVQRKSITVIQTCSVSLPGNVLLVSGNNTELTGFGKFSGKFHITESKHSLEKGGGYTTEIEAKKVDSIDKAKYKPKKTKNKSIVIAEEEDEE